jgi:uncharacterized protein
MYTTVPEPGMPQPVSTNPRILSIDVLRGIALLGILIISIWEFGGFSSNEQTRLRLLQKGFDYNLFSTIIILFEGKMRAIFSLVFGAGIILYLSKPQQPLIQTHELYIRRQMWLMAFGLVNVFILLWPGDILFQYGVMGILLFPFARMSKKGLLIAALIATLIYCGKNYWYYADDKKAYRKFKAITLVEDKFKKDSTERHRRDSLAGMPKDSIRVRDSIAKKNDTLTAFQQRDKKNWEGILKNLKYDSTKAGEKAENKAMRSGYGKIWNHVLQRSQNKESRWLYQIGVWDIGSMMLLGMALLGFGFFNHRFTKGTYLLLAVTGIIAGAMLGWFRLEFTHTKFIDYVKYINGHAIPPNFFFPVERLLLATGYASLVMLLLQANRMPWLGRALSATGQMAFTNYFIQTILCTLFFYGYGFGYFGRLSLTKLYFVVAEIALIQIVFSVIWLRYYKYGPVEWLWRRLVNRKYFSNKKTERPAL